MKTDIRAATVCVDFGDLLALTLPKNLRHFSDMIVVTSPEDERTKAVCRQHGAKTFETRAFWDGGAEFNKFKALELALDSFGRHGWMLNVDADTCWPEHATERITAMPDGPRPGVLYGALRRMLFEVRGLMEIPPERLWRHLPRHPGVNEWAGFTQLYHADDPILGAPPWHETWWRHAGGGDSRFMQKWSCEKKDYLPFEVLHLGPDGTNWFGRASPTADGTPLHPGAEERARRVKNLWIERAKTGFAKEQLSE